MGDAPAVVTVLMTAPDPETAEALGRTLVEERLAACTNIVSGVVSIYRWEGKMHRDAEVLMILKTTPDMAGALSARAAELHPYEVPEVLVLPVSSANPPYAQWVAMEVEG